MEIGVEDEPFVTEPLEDPFEVEREEEERPGRVPEPVERPERTPAPEKVPA